MDHLDATIVRRSISRRTVVRTGLRLAYVTPIVSASFRLDTLTAEAKKKNETTACSSCLVDKLAAGTNEPPVAVVGEGFTVTDEDGDGFADVTLDGSASTDPDGKITTYLWTLKDEWLSDQPVATVTLPIGTHRPLLTVTDDQGATAEKEIRIRVKAGEPRQDTPDEPEPQPETRTVILPAPPYRVEAKQKNAEIAITWKVDPGTAPPYHIYRAFDDGTLDNGLEHTAEEIDAFGWQLVREEWEKLSWRDANAEIGVPYLYSVRTFDGVNESERSNIARITMQPLPDEPAADAPPVENAVADPPTPTPTTEVVETVEPTEEPTVAPTPTTAPEDDSETPPPSDEGAA